MTPLRQLCFYEILFGFEDEFVEAAAFAASRRVVGQLVQGWAADERERLVQQLLGGDRVARLALGSAGGHERLEAVGIDHVRPQQVAVVARDQHLRTEPSRPRARDIRAQHRHGVGWWIAGPQRLDHPIRRDGLAAMQQEQREQRTLLRAAERKLLAVTPGDRLAQQSELQLAGGGAHRPMVYSPSP
jgi:hypothetical protein